MARQALFAGLVIDEMDNPVDVASVGGEAFYIVDDEGFRRHVESEHVDQQVLSRLHSIIQGHEDLITDGTMKMIGQEDIFTKAMIESQLKNVDTQFDALIESGLPEEVRAWLGMLGFRVIINIHGEVVKVVQPEMTDEDSED